MKALLTALAEGRLIELPEPDKQKALTLLASLIEAVPSVRPNSRVVEAVLAREAQSVTYLGHGWACPHARTGEEGDLLCAVGWSPTGLSYGNSDGQPVKVVLLYYVPDAQRNAYLKEISMLARCLGTRPDLSDSLPFADLSGVRLRLLDILTETSKRDEGEARARMIRLETRAVAAPPIPASAFDPALVIPAWIVRDTAGKLLVLAQDATLAKDLEAQPDLASRLAREPVILTAGYAVHVRTSSSFGLDRSLFDCLVVKPARK